MALGVTELVLGTFYRRGHEPQGIVGRSRDHRISRAYGTTIALPKVLAMTGGNHDHETSMGYSNPMGNYPPRHTLSVPVATALTEPHNQSDGEPIGRLPLSSVSPASLISVTADG